MNDSKKGFMNDSLNESNFDLTPSLQDQFDRIEGMDLISDTSSVRTSNSFQRVGNDLMPLMIPGLSPKSSKKNFLFNQKKNHKGNVRQSLDFKKGNFTIDNQFYEGKYFCFGFKEFHLIKL
jgi:hypothetical protein